MSGFALSLKATERRGATEDDPIAGLKRAQGDYEAADAGFRTRQREILQDVFRNVAGLIDDEEALSSFVNDKAFAKYVDGKGASSTDADRGYVWFRALAYVYRATSRAKRQRASKHASALWLLYSENVDAKKIAATIEKRGGLQKLADEAAKARRKGSKQSVSEDDAEREDDDNEVDGTESGDAEGDQEVRFDISDELTAKIRRWRGNRVKIIARISRKVDGLIKVLRVIKLDRED
jgi:hypothetical protein